MEPLFSIRCTTCQARLKVCDESAIGHILACPKCGSMVEVVAPLDWQLPVAETSQPVPWRGTPKDRESAAESSANLDPDLPSSEANAGEVVDQPSGWVSSTERRWRRVAMAGAAACGGLIVVAGVWLSLVPKSTPPEKAQVAVAEPVRDVAPEAPVSTEPKNSATATATRRWMPRETRLVIDASSAGGFGKSGVQVFVDQAMPWWKRHTEELLSALGLKAEELQRVSWHVVDPEHALGRSVVVIELPEGVSAAEVLDAKTVATDVTLAGIACRRSADAAWPHPLAAVDGRTIVTGPGELLTSFDAGPNDVFDRPSVILLSDELGRNGELTLVTALRESGELDEPPLFFLPSDEATVGAWQTVRRTPDALAIRVATDAERLTAELVLACDGETLAHEVYDAVMRLLPAAKESLEGKARSVVERLLAGTVSTATAAEIDRLVQSWTKAIDASHVALEGSTVQIKTVVADDASDWVAAVRLSLPVAAAQQAAAARNSDQENHTRLLTGLGAFQRAEGHWPVGAAGAVQLAPESRLSWLATMLPYYGHLDWHGELNFRRPWNAPHNRGVAARPLEAVVNPVLGASIAEGGFPVTHYVGLAGLGIDAGELAVDDPRAGFFSFRRSLSTGAVRDGLSNTIAIVGVSERLGAWAAGGEATVRAMTQRPYINGPDGFGSGQSDGMFVGMADGSVRFLSVDVDPTIVEHLATINGGETVDLASLTPAAPVAQTPATPSVDEIAESATTPTEQATSSEPQPDPPEVAEEPAKEPMPAEPSGPTIDVDAQLAMPLAGVRFDDVPLIDVVEFLAQSSRLAITLDAEALAEIGIAPDSPVRVRLADATLAALLETVLTEQGLALEIQSDQLLITSPQQEREALMTVRYSVADLVGGNEKSAADLASLVRQFVEPTAWHEAGGRGRLEAAGNELVIVQAASVIREVEDFCDRLRLARHRTPVDPDATLATPHVQTRELLETPVTANFPRPTRLVELVSYLADKSGGVILIDWLNLGAIGMTRDTTTTLRASDVPLEEALAALTAPLELAVRIIDGKTLQITTRDAQADRLEVEFYSVTDLVTADQPPETLIERVKGKVRGATWADAGGAGRIHFDAPGSCLVVLATQDAQIEIESLLDSWRPQTAPAAEAGQ